MCNFEVNDQVRVTDNTHGPSGVVDEEPPFHYAEIGAIGRVVTVDSDDDTLDVLFEPETGYAQWISVLDLEKVEKPA